MSVIDTGGMMLDINAAKEKLGKDRDSGKVSAREFKRISKGLNKITDASKKGLKYEFTGDGRFRTASDNGYDGSKTESGIGVSDKLGLLGRQVSKGMGYLQNMEQAKPETKETASDPVPEKKTDGQSGPKTRSDITAASMHLFPHGDLPVEKSGSNESFQSVFGKDYRFDTDLQYPGKNKNTRGSGVEPDVRLQIPNIGLIDTVEPDVSLQNPEVTEADLVQAKYKDAIRSVLLNFGPAKGVHTEPRPERTLGDKAKSLPYKGFKSLHDYEEWRKSHPTNNYRMGYKPGYKMREKIFAEGGKIVKFSGGGYTGIVPQRLQWPQKTGIEIPSWIGKYSGKPATTFGDRLSTMKSHPTMNTSLKIDKPLFGIDGDKRVLPPKTPNALNINPSKMDKSSMINNAMGLYGAASLLTAKRPKLAPPKKFSMAIRPAQGDEGMVNRSFNKINEATQGGVNELGKRTGSDISSYVQGATVMVDNAGKAKADVLGANAQMKRQDENRQFGEVNQERQINLNLDEQFRREQNLTNENIYSGRVQGAQAAVNNALNYGVQKRANETNNQVQMKMANKRIEFLLQSEASKMRQSGASEEEITEWLDTQRQVARSYASGGKLSDGARMQIANNRDLSEANKRLQQIFMEYKKLIASASLESIKAFNANIRTINQRNNITITRR